MTSRESHWIPGQTIGFSSCVTTRCMPIVRLESATRFVFFSFFFLFSVSIPFPTSPLCRVSLRRGVRCGFRCGFRFWQLLAILSRALRKRQQRLSSQQGLLLTTTVLSPCYHFLPIRYAPLFSFWIYVYILYIIYILNMYLCTAIYASVLIRVVCLTIHTPAHISALICLVYLTCCIH